MNKRKYMELAIKEAIKGKGFTNPNPLVGAIIVKDDRVVSIGYHKKYGQLHAERNAINSSKEDLSGSCMYVTLEPCCHYGKTPPCTEAIINSGIKKVVVGSYDPNPLVAGGGIKQLKDAGIEVVEGFMKEECDEINKIFFHYIKTKTPYVIMKYAMTADGKIATKTGKSKWITGENSRLKVHKLRNRCAGIMVGVGTVLADNPMLNCRLERGNDPIRIICDSNLKTPLDSNIVKTAKEIKTIIATASNDSEKKALYEKEGCEILKVENNDKVDIEKLMYKLGEKGVDSILLEGGGTLNYSVIKAGFVNEIFTFIGPKIFGGDGSKSPVSGSGIEDVNDALTLEKPKISIIDKDVLIRWEVSKCLQE